MLAFLFQGAGIGLSAALSPGPYQSLVIAQTLTGGWRRAAPVVFGPLLADPVIAFAMVFAVSQVPDNFLRFVKFGGAALLIYLAWTLWQEMRRNPSPQSTQEVAIQSPWRGLIQGALMIFLSPGSYLYWALVLGPLLLEALQASWMHAAAFLVAFYGCSAGGLLLIVSAIDRLGQLSPRAHRFLQTGSLLLMVAIAALLIDNGLRT